MIVAQYFRALTAFVHTARCHYKDYKVDKITSLKLVSKQPKEEQCQQPESDGQPE